MRQKIGIACMILGTVCISLALSLFLWNRWEDRQAKNASDEILPLVIEKISTLEATTTDMPSVNIDGYDYIGYLSIPSLELKLPVMSHWSYDQLEISPCRYSGSIDTNDLVIAAHNYSAHFGNIKSLYPGDNIYFTNMNGMTISYTVAEIETFSATAVEEMTSGNYALTLFTCTYGGQSRVSVRCHRIYNYK